MDPSLKKHIQVFDPVQEYSVFERKLPHWAQAGTVCFITWRTWDSIPESVLKTWLTARDQWLHKHGIDPGQVDWKSRVQQLDRGLVLDFKRLIADRWNEHLDECHGACMLKNPELSQIVSDSLRHFDGDRYDLLDFVVMPNHVHLLAAFPSEPAMLTQCESWKHFTATKINRQLRLNRRFWQQDGFDHLVRSLEYLRQYIADNPRRARLRVNEFVHWSRPM